MKEGSPVSFDKKTGYRKVLPDGRFLSVEPLSTLFIDRGIDRHRTSFHEACHTVLALYKNIGVKHVTNIAEGDSAGHIAVEKFDPVVAAASIAMGCDGTGADEAMILESGYDLHKAVAEARRILAGRTDEILAIATLIEARRMVSGTETWQLSQEVSDIKKNGERYLVRTINRDGAEEVKEERVALDDTLTITLDVYNTEHSLFT